MLNQQVQIHQMTSHRVSAEGGRGRRRKEIELIEPQTVPPNLTFRTFTTSGGNCIIAVLETRLYIRSTNMPARIACATERNLGFSSDFLRVVANWRVKVEANHSLTSGGTASGCTSDSSSSSSASRLQDCVQEQIFCCLWGREI